MIRHCFSRFVQCTPGFLVLLLAALVPGTTYAQSEILLLPASAISSSLGGAGAALPSTDAAATIGNPAQVGLFSLDNSFNASYCSREISYRNSWACIPGSESPFRTFALNAGINLARLVSIPFPVSLGVGYSRLSYEITGNVSHQETSQGFSLAIGADYYVRVGAGMTLKRLESNYHNEFRDELYDPTPESNKGQGRDFGLLLTLPVTDIVSKLTGDTLKFSPKARPLLDISTCYVESNYGDMEPLPGIPFGQSLPTTSTLGLAVEAAVLMRSGNSEWKLVSLSLTRQAEALTAINMGGKINFVDNVIGGSLARNLTVRQGLQFALAETFAYRRGTIKGSGAEVSGYSFYLGGLFRLLRRRNPALGEIPWFAFCCDRADLQLHATVDEGYYPPSSRPVGLALNLVVRDVL